MLNRLRLSFVIFDPFPKFYPFDPFEIEYNPNRPTNKWIVTVLKISELIEGWFSVLLQKVMDPPRDAVVDDALELLVHIKALEKTSPRGRYEPTFYGRLLSSFSLSFDASMLILKFGEAGMLREGIIIGILMDTQPLPVIRPFGNEAQVLLIWVG